MANESELGGAPAAPEHDGSPEEPRSGWQFELTRTVGDETHFIRQYLTGSRKSLQDPAVVIPVLRKFLAKLANGDVLVTGAYTGTLGTGTTSSIVEVKMVGSQFILIRGNGVYEGTSAVSGAEVEKSMSALLVTGVAQMAEQEAFDDEWRKQYTRTERSTSTAVNGDSEADGPKGGK